MGAYARALLAVLLAAGTISCGYHLSGTGSLVPPGTETIAVPSFVNSTNEPYVDVEVTKAVIDEFIADGRLHVVDVEVADLVLRGRTVKYEAIPVSYTASTYVQQYRVRLVVDVVLEDLRSKKVLWQEKGIEAVFISDYAVLYNAAGQVDITTTKILKERAITRASQDIALTLRSRVLEGF
jgi:outer membrane lipopolysaccharide assembly protein LptE/RlpB